MNLKDILAIAGKPGLYKFISQGRNGIIVESFTDGKRAIIHASSKVSALEDIAIYTDTEEVSLGDIFNKIYERQDGKETISHKTSSDELKTFFDEILPDYDKERVYVSDIKKVINWYNLLISLNLLDPDESEDVKDEAKEKDVKKPETAKDKIEKAADKTNKEDTKKE